MKKYWNKGVALATKAANAAKGAALAVLGVVTGMAASVQDAAAALPVAISTQLTAVQTDGLALADLVWPVVITLFGSMVMFKLFKRFGNKI